MSIQLTTLYEYDPTGMAVANRIINESATVTPPESLKDFSYIIPKAMPYFADSLVVKDGKGPGARILQENVDYWCSIDFISASVHLKKRICSGITILDSGYNGTLYLTYQTLGGNFGLDDIGTMEELIRDRYTNRHISYEQIINLPAAFAPSLHEHNVSDMVGMSDVLATLEKIKEALLATPGKYAQLEQFMQSHLSVDHAHSKAQVGLGNVENYGVASLDDIKAGAHDKYVTANHLKNHAGLNTDQLMELLGNKDIIGLLKSKLGITDKDNLVKVNWTVSADGELITPSIRLLINSLAINGQPSLLDGTINVDYKYVVYEDFAIPRNKRTKLNNAITHLTRTVSTGISKGEAILPLTLESLKFPADLLVKVNMAGHRSSDEISFRVNPEPIVTLNLSLMNDKTENILEQWVSDQFKIKVRASDVGLNGVARVTYTYQDGVSSQHTGEVNIVNGYGEMTLDTTSANLNIITRLNVRLTASMVNDESITTEDYKLLSFIKKPVIFQPPPDTGSQVIPPVEVVPPPVVRPEPPPVITPPPVTVPPVSVPDEPALPTDRSYIQYPGRSGVIKSTSVNLSFFMYMQDELLNKRFKLKVVSDEIELLNTSFTAEKNYKAVSVYLGSLPRDEWRLITITAEHNSNTIIRNKFMLYLTDNEPRVGMSSAAQADREGNIVIRTAQGGAGKSTLFYHNTYTRIRHGEPEITVVSKYNRVTSRTKNDRGGYDFNLKLTSYGRDDVTHHLYATVSDIGPKDTPEHLMVTGKTTRELSNYIEYYDHLAGIFHNPNAPVAPAPSVSAPAVDNNDYTVHLTDSGGVYVRTANNTVPNKSFLINVSISGPDNKQYDQIIKSPGNNSVWYTIPLSKFGRYNCSIKLYHTNSNKSRLLSYTTGTVVLSSPWDAISAPGGGSPIKWNSVVTRRL